MGSVHLSQLIDRAPEEVYAYASDPRHLPEWAAGLSGSIAEEGGTWVADSPMGRVVVEFAAENEYGVLDHVVVLPGGERVYNPMRVMVWDNRSEVVFSLRRRPGMTDEQLARDVDAVRTDLSALKAVLERRA
jgi:hypothetical protein